MNRAENNKKDIHFILYYILRELFKCLKIDYFYNVDLFDKNSHMEISAQVSEATKK